MKNLLRRIAVGGVVLIAVLSVALVIAKNTNDLLTPVHVLPLLMSLAIYLLPMALASYRSCKAALWIAVLFKRCSAALLTTLGMPDTPVNHSTYDRRWTPGICRQVAAATLALGAMFVLTVLADRTAQAQGYSEKVLYSFAPLPNVNGPQGGPLLLDHLGNLYGVTYMGGADNDGGVFKLDPTGRETVLYSFTGSGGDGVGPLAGLVRDPRGNLYGTTYTGGDLACSFGRFGCGIVFELDTAGKETVLYEFTGMPDGGLPSTDLVRDARGNLYGNTVVGGTYDQGTVFKLDPTGKETVLYSFTRTNGDGAEPNSLVLDAQGNLYGTTEIGGTYDQGTVFKLDPTGKETVLYSFTGARDGGGPGAGLVRDARGNLYGTTEEGGDLTCPQGQVDGYQLVGTVFEVDATGKETVLYSFTGTGGDGVTPATGVARDARGDLYGTTFGGGVDGYGTVFKLDRTGKETVLHSFNHTMAVPDGALPFAGLVMDARGNLYGTTYAGGANDYGTVFELSPDRQQP